jgi:hypothetical protein
METTMGAKWAVPAIGIASGLLLFAASAIGGQPVLGLGMLAIMVIYSILVVGLSGRSETAGILAGRPADERLASFNVVATAVAGTVAIVVAIAGFLVSIARGESGMDFALVAAAAGIAYLVAIGWLRWRG